MTIETSRRNFLIGSASAVTALAMSPTLTMAKSLVIVKGIIPSRYRRVYDIMISCDSFVRDAAINHKIYRNHDVLFASRINARAAYRWVAVPGGEMVFLEKDVMIYDVDPSTAQMQIQFCMLDRAGKAWSEYFKWTDDKLISASCIPMEAMPKDV
jgi:hypothetical protein